MRITHEADYAIRVVYCLAESGGKLSAKTISEQTGVTLRFSLKILRKLILAELVQSYKGVSGGYALLKSPDQISLGEIIECIDGPIAINHCLSNEFDCARAQSQFGCGFRKVFASVNQTIRQELYAVTIDRFIS